MNPGRETKFRGTYFSLNFNQLVFKWLKGYIVVNRLNTLVNFNNITPSSSMCESHDSIYCDFRLQWGWKDACILVGVAIAIRRVSSHWQLRSSRSRHFQQPLCKAVQLLWQWDKLTKTTQLLQWFEECMNAGVSTLFFSVSGYLVRVHIGHWAPLGDISCIL